jgi:hypothetical protein
LRRVVAQCAPVDEASTPKSTQFWEEHHDDVVQISKLFARKCPKNYPRDHFAGAIVSRVWKRYQNATAGKDPYEWRNSIRNWQGWLYSQCDRAAEDERKQIPLPGRSETKAYDPETKEMVTAEPIFEDLLSAPPHVEGHDDKYFSLIRQLTRAHQEELSKVEWALLGAHFRICEHCQDYLVREAEFFRDVERKSWYIALSLFQEELREIMDAIKALEQYNAISDEQVTIRKKAIEDLLALRSNVDRNLKELGYVDTAAKPLKSQRICKECGLPGHNARRHKKQKGSIA